MPPIIAKYIKDTIPQKFNIVIIFSLSILLPQYSISLIKVQVFFLSGFPTANTITIFG